jgi:ATP-dependent Clp protease adapter protein ClpS
VTRTSLPPDEAHRLSRAGISARAANARLRRDQLIRDIADESARTAIREFVQTVLTQHPDETASEAVDRVIAAHPEGLSIAQRSAIAQLVTAAAGDRNE